MKTVNISELKAHLSAHIQSVREGEEVLVRDRDRVVARIVPCNTEDFSEHEQRLIARGLMRPPLEPRPAKWPMPTGKKSISNEVMEQVWREERGD